MAGARVPVLLLIALAVVWPGVARPAGFLTDPRAALAASRDTGSPLLIEFHTTWCAACELMRDTTWKDSRVLDLMEAFVALSVDGDRDRNLRARFSVEAFPTILMTDAGGRVVLSLQGFQDAAAMTGHLSAVLADWERLADWADRSSGRSADPEAWLALADFARARDAWLQAETLYRRALVLKRGSDAGVAGRARSGLARVLAATDRCREARRLMRDAVDADTHLDGCAGTEPAPPQATTSGGAGKSRP